MSAKQQLMAITDEPVTTINMDYGSNASVNDDNNCLNLDRPRIFQIPQSAEYVKETKFFNRDIFVRLSRFIFICSLPLIFLLVLTNQSRKGAVDLAFLIGLAVEIMYVIYFSIIGYLFWSGSRWSERRYLFRIWTRSEPVPGWATMNIATHQQLYEFEAIQSISEFSAIDGGVPSYMLQNLGTFTWAVVTMHFASQIQCNSSTFHWDAVAYLEIIGVCGLVMIGIFELDPYNPAMRFFHYLGAAAGIGTIAGFVLQQYSLSKAQNNGGLLVAPIFITILALTCFILWQFSNKQTVRYQNEIRSKYHDKDAPSDEEMVEIKREITRYSLRNVIFEGIFLFCGATSLAIWLMSYNQLCELGCARG